MSSSYSTRIRLSELCETSAKYPTFASLASALCVSENLLSQWNTGRSHPDAEACANLCLLFKCKFADLTVGPGDAKPKPAPKRIMVKRARIKELCEASDDYPTLPAVADAINRSPWTVRAWDAGKTLPNRPSCEAICELFNVPFEQLIEYEVVTCGQDSSGG